VLKSSGLWNGHWVTIPDTWPSQAAACVTTAGVKTLLPYRQGRAAPQVTVGCKGAQRATLHLRHSHQQLADIAIATENARECSGGVLQALDYDLWITKTPCFHPGGQLLECPGAGHENTAKPPDFETLDMTVRMNPGKRQVPALPCRFRSRR